MEPIYGWAEQTEACWGIEQRFLEGDENIELVDRDGRLIGDLRHGEWYSSFALAKLAAIALWKRRLDVARIALRDIKHLKRADVQKPPCGGVHE